MEKNPPPLPVTGSQPHLLDPERAGESSLLNEIREYRASVKFEDATSNALRLIRDCEQGSNLGPIGEDSPSEIAEKGTAWHDDNLDFSFNRQLFRSFDAGLGLPDGELIEKSRKMLLGEEQEFPVGPGVALVVKSTYPGMKRVSHNISVDPAADAAERESSVRGFIDRVRAHQARFDDSMEQIATKIEAGELEAYSTTTHSFAENPDELISLLNGSRLYERPEDISPIISAQKVIENIYKLPSHYSGEPTPERREGLYFDEHGNIIKVLVPTYKPGVYIALRSADPTQRGDLGEIAIYPGIERYPVEIYAIEPDDHNDRYEGVLPFVETPTAADILTAFDRAGLSITQRVKDAFAEVGSMSTRFGHGYADLTREIAKLVDDRSRPLTAFFAPQEDLEQRIRGLDSSHTTPSAKIVIDLLKGVVERGATGSVVVPEVTLSNQRVELSNGSCKDIEVYIVGGAEVTQEEGGAPHMFQSAYKVPTFLTLQPLILNGVELPTGSLLRKEDDGYIFLRITRMALPDEEASIVYGAQDAENRRNPSFETRVSKIRSLMVDK